MILRLGLAALLIAGLAKVASAMGAGEKERKSNLPPPAIRLAEVDGRQYEVIRRNRDVFEVISRSNPEIFVVFGEQGILARSGDTKLLEDDMRKFPKDLFA